MSKSTAVQYLNRLSVFSVFLNKEFDGLKIDSLVDKIKEKTADPYRVWSPFTHTLRVVTYLQLQ